MAAKSRGRKLRIESLERRALLSGTVTVSVVSGTLVVTGDSNANVVAIDQVDMSGTSGTVAPGSFLITPDAKTALNGGKAGTPLTVSGATAGAQINLGAGNDSLDMQGVAGQPLSPFSISIAAGAGYNTIRLADFSVSTLSVACANKGTDSVEIDGTTIDGGGGGSGGTTPALVLQAQQGYASAVLAGDDIGPTSNSGTPVTAVGLSASNFALAIRDTTISGSATVTAWPCKWGCAVQVHNSTMTGALGVTSLGPGNVALDQMQADAATIKLGSLPSDQSSVDVSGSLVTHKLDIETTGGSDGSVEDSTAGELYLKLDGIQADLTAANGVTVGGGLTVSTHGKVHKGELDGLLYDNGTLKMGSSAADHSLFDVTDNQVAHKLDLETTGGANGSVENSTAGELYLKLDGIQADLTAANGVTVGGGLTVSADKGHDGWVELNGVQADDVSLKMGTSAAGQSSFNVTGSQVSHKLDIETTGSTAGSVENSGGGELYLKLDGIQADLTAANGVAVGGGLTVSADKRHDGWVELNGVQADDVSLKMGTSAAGQSSFNVTDSQVAHKLDIETTGSSDGSVENSGGGEIYLKIDGILEDLASDAGAADATVGGALTVSTHGATHKAEAHNIQADSFTVKMGTSAADRSVLDVSESQVTHKLDIESAGRMSWHGGGEHRRRPLPEPRRDPRGTHGRHGRRG